MCGWEFHAIKSNQYFHPVTFIPETNVQLIESYTRAFIQSTITNTSLKKEKIPKLRVRPDVSHLKQKILIVYTCSNVQIIQFTLDAPISWPFTKLN